MKNYPSSWPRAEITARNAARSALDCAARPSRDVKVHVDLEQFYSEDPRRRHSEELEFGRGWTDDNGRCEVSWVEATGELYVMREPDADIHPAKGGGFTEDPVDASQLVVEVLGVVSGRGAIESVMSGWESAMHHDSLQWVRDRVANAAAEMNDKPARPSSDLDQY